MKLNREELEVFPKVNGNKKSLPVPERPKSDLHMSLDDWTEYMKKPGAVCPCNLFNA